MSLHSSGWEAPLLRLAADCDETRDDVQIRRARALRACVDAGIADAEACAAILGAVMRWTRMAVDRWMSDRDPERLAQRGPR